MDPIFWEYFLVKYEESEKLNF